MNKAIFESFQGEVKFDEPLSKHTSWRVGGPAAAMVFPKNPHNLATLIKYLRRDEIPYTVIGNGSNILVPDKGYKGTVINLKRGFDALEEISKSETEVLLRVGAGVSKYRLLQYGLLHGYVDLTFLAGIPGTVGGGLAMNAGTREGAFDSVTETVLLIDEQGDLINLEKNSLEFGYRAGVRKGIIVECTLRSRIGSIEEMTGRIKNFMAMRKDTQPLTFPSCGSTFKNPRGKSAGNLIEEAGLKGFRIGDAQISLQHANFIVNLGKASCKDIEALIDHIKNIVQDKFGIQLSEEVQRLEAC